MQYISSAGLRVLLIMHKASREGLSLTGTNEVVKKILEETGFDQFFSLG
ncbi:MAG: STAS domain-containing protein [Lachnospiraceae bacterium]|nr:STAS domain-containing protein [Lachnospiraceae bacterium]